MPISDMEAHKLLADIAEVKTDIKYIRESLLEMNLTGKDRERRIASLETSREYAKATLATTWAGLIWVGWDWIQSLFRG